MWSWSGRQPELSQPGKCTGQNPGSPPSAVAPSAVRGPRQARAGGKCASSPAGRSGVGDPPSAPRAPLDGTRRFCSVNGSPSGRPLRWCSHPPASQRAPGGGSRVKQGPEHACGAGWLSEAKGKMPRQLGLGGKPRWDIAAVAPSTGHCLPALRTGATVLAKRAGWELVKPPKPAHPRDTRGGYCAASP